MSEDNSPSNEENQEPQTKETAEPEEIATIPPPGKDNSPSNEENQEPEETETAEPEEIATIPPPANHGWLEQFQAFGLEAWRELEGVASQGLVAAEAELLITLSVKLIRLAHEHDPQALNKFLAEVDDLN